MTYQSSTKARACAPVAIALLACLPALASAAGDSVIQSTSAQITGLNYRLIDLDSADGIAPSLTFDLTSAALYADTYGDIKSDQVSQYGPVDYYGLTPNDTTTVSLHGATASLGPSVFSSSIHTTVDQYLNLAQQPEAGGTVTLNSWIGSNPNGINSMNMTLSANTLLVITGSASITGQTNLQPLLDELNLRNPGEEAWASTAYGASANINLTLQRRIFDPATNTETNDESSFHINNYFADMINDVNSPVTLQFANLGTSSTDLSFTVNLGVTNSIQSGLNAGGIIDLPPSIPEPGTYMLMGLGLVGLGLARRRASA